MDSNGLVRGLRSQVADRLRDDILTGRIKPGEKLAEIHLVKRFGVSRAPVREALVQLTQEGLLVGQANRGVRVTLPASDELQELFLPIRSMLELFALKRCFAGLGEEQFRQWKDILAKMKAACQARDYAASAEADIAFHRLIIEMADEPDVLKLWTSLAGRLRVYFQSGHRSYAKPLEVYREHQALLDVFQGGDLEQALLALKKDIRTQASPVKASAAPG